MKAVGYKKSLPIEDAQSLFDFEAAKPEPKGRDVRVAVKAISANPVDYTVPYLRAFDRQEGLDGVRNWMYLTGSIGQLRKVWASYGITAVTPPGGGMVAHNDLVFVIDAAGRVRFEVNSDPGPGTTTSMSSFAVEFAQLTERALSADGSKS